MRQHVSKFLVAGFLTLQTIAVQAQVTLVFTGVASGQGQVAISVWDSAGSYLKRPYLAKRFSVGTVIDGELQVLLQEPLPKFCVVSAYYDKNNNGELDTNWLGVPLEAVGTTNDAQGKFGPPSYAAGLVEITGGAQVLHIPLRYVLGD